MTNNNKVLIHGKEYITVAGRLQMAHEALKKISITTEVLPHDTMVIVKATVTTDKGVFTGISAANPSKVIEKMSPYEVAETSAVGRALGFAGYGAVDGIATADEMKKATTEDTPPDPTDDFKPLVEESNHFCKIHNKEMVHRGPNNYDHRMKLGANMQYDANGSWHLCRGSGWHLSETK